MLRSLLLVTFATGAAFAQSFSTNDANPTVERWMYANATSYEPPYAPVFGYFGEEDDTRLGQFLIGWDTAGFAPTNYGPSRYLIRQCRVTLTINRGNWFAYDPTQDDYRTYFETNHPQYLADADFGRPVELFGAGFRNGFTTATYEQTSPFGGGLATERNAYAAGWSTNGVLVDVSNNVGKTNTAEFPRFEVWPFAIGQTTNAAPGHLVPAGAKMRFTLNLADPFVMTYLQRGLNEGRLRFTVATLHLASGQFGNPLYPDFATHFNQALIDPTRLELDVTVVRDLDSNSNGLPDDWEQFYFTNLTQTASADFDGDGVSNENEFRAGTNPTEATSVFQISTFQHAGQQSELHWPNLPSRRFEVDFSDELTTWQTLTNPAVQFPTAATAIWSETTNAPARYYRVRAVTD
jgi:hypothetical protein